MLEKLNQQAELKLKVKMKQPYFISKIYLITISPFEELIILIVYEKTG